MAFFPLLSEDIRFLHYGFLFLSHLQDLSCEISFVRRLKRLYRCFSSHLSSLFISVIWWLCCLYFLMAFINFPPRWCMQSLSINTIMNAGKSCFSFFSWHIQSIFVFSGMLNFMHRRWFSCSLLHSSSLIDFKKGHEYLIRTSIWWDSCNVVSSSFLVLRRNYFLIFFSFYLRFDVVRFQYT